VTDNGVQVRKDTWGILSLEIPRADGGVAVIRRGPGSTVSISEIRPDRRPGSLRRWDYSHSSDPSWVARF